MKLFKRLTAFLLVLTIFTLSFSSLTVLAEDNYEFVAVKVMLSEDASPITIKMMKDGDDLYIGTNDVPKVVMYKHVDSNSKDVVSYKRGYKTVEFSLTDSKVYFPNQNLESEYYGAKYDNGMYYLSLSSILPWLDAKAYNENGNLLIQSEPIIFWEVYEEFMNLPHTDFGAHLGGDYKAAGDTIIKTIFLDNLFGLTDIKSTTLKLVPAGKGYSYFTRNNYMDCLFKICGNNPFEQEEIKEFFQDTGIMNNFGGIAKKAGVDLSTMTVSEEFELWMSEHHFDNAARADVYHGVEEISETFKLLKGVKYAKLLAEWASCLYISTQYPTKCLDSLNSLSDYSLKNIKDDEVIWNAVENTKKDLQDNERRIIRSSVEFGFGEALNLALDSNMVSVISKFAVAIAKALNKKEFTAIDKVSKIPVYADLEYTARNMIQDYKGLRANMEIPSKMLHGVLIASLTTKKSLEAFKAWDSLKNMDLTDIDKQIIRCDEIFAKAIMCSEGLEYEMALSYSTNPDLQPPSSDFKHLKKWQEEEYYNRMAFTNLTYGIFENSESDLNSSFGAVISTPEGTVYWKYNEKSYEITSYSSTRLSEKRDARNELIINKDGISNAIITCAGFGNIAYSAKTNRIYFLSYDLYSKVINSCNLDGSDWQEHSECGELDEIIGITASGSHLIYSDNNGAIISMDTVYYSTRYLIMSPEFTDERFLTCFGETIYYSGNDESNTVSLQSINADGSDQRELYIINNDIRPIRALEYFGIGHIFVNDNYIYFSYGIYPHIGDNSPKSRIVRLAKDRSTVELIPENNELVSKCFAVDNNGQIKYGYDEYFQLINNDYFYTNTESDPFPPIGFFEEDTGTVTEYKIPIIDKYSGEWDSHIDCAVIIDDILFIDIVFTLTDYHKNWRGEIKEFAKVLIAMNTETNDYTIIYDNLYR